jgi:hypothetical protein
MVLLVQENTAKNDQRTLPHTLDLYLPQLPWIYRDLKAFLIGLFEQWAGYVSIDTLAPKVCVQKTASHVVARLLERVPELWAIPRAPTRPIWEKRGGDSVCWDCEIEKNWNCWLRVAVTFQSWFLFIEAGDWSCKTRDGFSSTTLMKDDY